jgi:hypothetical protein
VRNSKPASVNGKLRASATAARTHAAKALHNAATHRKTMRRNTDVSQIMSIDLYTRR